MHADTAIKKAGEQSVRKSFKKTWIIPGIIRGSPRKGVVGRFVGGLSVVPEPAVAAVPVVAPVPMPLPIAPVVVIEAKEREAAA